MGYQQNGCYYFSYILFYLVFVNSVVRKCASQNMTEQIKPIVEQLALIPKLELGEGPFWDNEKQSLYFVDIFGKTIHKYDTAKCEHTYADMDEHVSVIIPVKGKKDLFVLGLGLKVALVSWDGFSQRVTWTQIIGQVQDGSGNRFNDGKCDPAGRLWIGTMGPEPEYGHSIPERGALFSVEKKDIKFHFDQVGISNGLAFNTDLKKMYYIDTFKYTVDQFDFDVETGQIANRTSIFDLKKHGFKGGPDGMAIDTDGNLWVAVFMGYCVIKIDPRRPDTLLQTVNIPAKQVTSVAFGGPNLDELYVTSASFTIDGEVLSEDVHGAIYRIKNLGVQGYAGNRFVIDSMNLDEYWDKQKNLKHLS